MAAAVNNLPTLLQNLDPGLRLGDISGLAAGERDMKHASSQDSITASVTQTQPGGTILLASISRITSANASDAVTLGFQATPGRSFVILNDSGQTIQLFPFLGDKLCDAVANASVTIADNTYSDYTCPVAGKWFGGATSFET